MEHLHIINAIEPDERVKEPPVGALILAIQAVSELLLFARCKYLTFLQVHRALLYSISGEFELPSDRKSSEFSKNNWGDYTLITPRGDRIVKRSSVFLKAIKNLKDQQWVDIFKVAMSFRATAKQPSKAEKDEEELLSETDSDEYDELVDPRYIDKPVEVSQQYSNVCYHAGPRAVGPQQLNSMNAT